MERIPVAAASRPRRLAETSPKPMACLLSIAPRDEGQGTLVGSCNPADATVREIFNGLKRLAFLNPVKPRRCADAEHRRVSFAEHIEPAAGQPDLPGP